MTGNQRVSDGSKLPFLTAPSDVELVVLVASKVRRTVRKLRRDRFFKERRDFPTGNYWISTERAPGLRCSLRINWHREFNPKYPRRPDFKKPTTYLLLDFAQYPYCSRDPREVFLSQSPPRKQRETFRYLNKPIRELTVQIGLSHIKRRSPYQKPYRIVDRWRFAEGKSAWLWRTIFVDPNQPVDEIRLYLLLFLRQEGMIGTSVDETLLKLVGRCFKIKDEGEALLVLHGDTQRGGLMKNFTLPEDWRAMKLYVRQVRRSLKRKEPCSPEIVLSDDLEKEQEVKEREAHGRVYTGKSSPPQRIEIMKPEDGKYLAKEAVKRLTAEGYEVSLDRLYDWMNKGKIKYRYEKGQKVKTMRCLEQEGLEMARQELHYQKKRKALMEYLTEIKGKEAARKYLTRHLQKGESIEHITRLLTRTQHET